MARRRSWTVGGLADASELDVEQTLVALWGEGIEYPLEPNARIKPEDVARAERAVGIAGSRQKRISYWLDEYGVTRDELEVLLKDEGVVLNKQAQTLPKGWIRRLKQLQPPRESNVSLPEAIPALREAPPHSWVPPGNVRQCQYLSAAEILQVHEALTADFEASDDPIFPPGVKSQELLESAAGRPATGFGDIKKYPTVESAAAALLHSLVQNHPFHNGNKRSALVSMLVFLDRHNLVLTSTQVELFKFMIQVAAHDLLDPELSYGPYKADYEVATIAAWIARRSRPIRREDRAVTWREASKLLRSLGCSVEQGRGEWVTIQRVEIIRRSFLRGSRTRVLESRFRNTGEGRQVPKGMLKKMRRELELDAEHGYDSEVFYGDAKDPDFFIIENSQVLRRLARV